MMPFGKSSLEVTAFSFGAAPPGNVDRDFGELWYGLFERGGRADDSPLLRGPNTPHLIGWMNLASL